MQKYLGDEKLASVTLNILFHQQINCYISLGGVTEDETVGWHQGLSGHESVQILGDSEGQERLQSMGCAVVHGVAKSQT